MTTEGQQPAAALDKVQECIQRLSGIVIAFMHPSDMRTPSYAECDEAVREVDASLPQLLALAREAARLRGALEDARHHLVTLDGLYATDRFDAYNDALENGCDSNAAYDSLCDVVWVIDEKPCIQRIDIVFGPLPGGGAP